MDFSAHRLKPLPLPMINLEMWNILHPSYGSEPKFNHLHNHPVIGDNGIGYMGAPVLKIDFMLA